MFRFKRKNTVVDNLILYMEMIWKCLSTHNFKTKGALELFGCLRQRIRCRQSEHLRNDLLWRWSPIGQYLSWAGRCCRLGTMWYLDMLLQTCGGQEGHVTLYAFMNIWSASDFECPGRECHAVRILQIRVCMRQWHGVIINILWINGFRVTNHGRHDRKVWHIVGLT